MSKILTVFGATGNQGGSVIDSVLADPVLSKEFTVRAVTRDASKPAAQALSKRGVEVVTGDLSDPSAAVQGAHTVFLVTNFWETMSAATEVAQGKAVADASKAAGVQHLVFSSLIHVSDATDGRLQHVSHFDSKADVERYIRDGGVPATFVLPGFFMANFVDFIRKNDDGSYALALPVDGDKAQVPVFDAAGDTGKFVKAAIKHFPSKAGTRVLAATNYLSPNQVMAEFSEAIGKPASYAQVSADVFKSFLPAPAAQELFENMLLLEGPGYYAGESLDASLALLDEKPTTWKAFVEANKEKWL